GDVLDARIEGVPDADMAANILVKLPDFIAVVPLDAGGVTVTPRKIWDESRNLSDVDIAGYAVPAEDVIARGDAAAELAAKLRGEMLLALAADCLGGASAALDMTVEYMKM